MTEVWNIAPRYVCKVCGREMKLHKVLAYANARGEKRKDLEYRCYRCKREYTDTIRPNVEFTYNRVELDIADVFLTGEIKKTYLTGDKR